MPPLYDSAFPLPPKHSAEFPGVPASPETRTAILNAGSPISQAELDEQYLYTLLQPPHPELDQAIDGGDADRVLYELAAARSRFNPDATFNTAIDRAIKCGRVDIMRLLMENGIPVNTEHLEAAARSGHVLVLAHLIEHLSWPVNEVSDHGLTLLTLAVENRDMVMWLLSQGADINKEDAYSETPLSRAAQNGTEAVIMTLLERGADVTRGAPLQASLLRKEGNANLEVTRKLLAWGAPVDKFAGENSSLWEAAAFEQMTALHVACYGSHRNLAAVRLLLQHGADPRLNKRFADGELPNTSAFDSAQRRGYTDIIAVM
ncbi:Hypothetical protein R9X50_00177600 [Acrodontium crateriforme]|uniref:Ankyrin n=1 Tax=Acrodontium crateriforme TaxID=150365 RepID=A0AAQ3LZX6_9PEZI|nr:Hypothetical protein R9X50_00177600 [Acrodontium crateriforme]